eukprot:m.35270 g.35270  ORF g.35270 m.35270 type:complete len:116 (+) comp6595_c0_seq2:565-912(+)
MERTICQWQWQSTTNCIGKLTTESYQFASILGSLICGSTLANNDCEPSKTMENPFFTINYYVNALFNYSLFFLLFFAAYIIIILFLICDCIDCKLMFFVFLQRKPTSLIILLHTV